MGFFEGVKSPKLKNVKKGGSSNTPDGFWKKCTNCGEILQASKLSENMNVCPYCDHHFRINAFDRIQFLVDEGSFHPFPGLAITSDPLDFYDKKSYKDRLESAYEATGSKDAILAGIAKIEGQEVSMAVMNFAFMGGSMGVVVGEKIAECLNVALDKKIPALVISCSGGARMQEGILSLMQMAKTSAARQKLKEEGIPYISLLADPTTGGCAASFAMLGDVNLAEPKALVGFAGPRVIQQTIRQTLPEGFQRSEFLLERGFIDRIVHRAKLREEISFFMKMFSH